MTISHVAAYLARETAAATAKLDREDALMASAADGGPFYSDGSGGPVRGLPDRDGYCPRCEGRIEQIVRIAHATAAATLLTGKADLDAVAQEAERLARVELAAANGCWG